MSASLAGLAGLTPLSRPLSALSPLSLSRPLSPGLLPRLSRPARPLAALADDRLEWTGFAIAAAPAPLIAVPPLTTLALPSWAAWARLFASAWPDTLLAAPWAFVLAEVTSMLPRALRGHAWYRRTFEAYPAKRRAAIPYVL